MLKENYKLIILGLIAGLVIFFAFKLMLGNAGAHGRSGDDVPGQECLQGAVTNNPHCNPSPTPNCFEVWGENWEDHCVITVPTVIIDLTPTPTAGESARLTPTKAPEGGPGDGLSDGKSDGRSSCPDCTKAPAYNPDWEKLPLK